MRSERSMRVFTPLTASAVHERHDQGGAEIDQGSAPSAAAKSSASRHRQQPLDYIDPRERRRVHWTQGPPPGTWSLASGLMGSSQGGLVGTLDLGGPRRVARVNACKERASR